MLRSMTWQEFMAWQAYDQIEPLGDKRGDWQAASVCAAVMTAATRGARVFSPEMFLLEFKDASNVVAQEPPKPAAPHWHSMKFTARMQVALANADEQKKQRKQRRKR